MKRSICSITKLNPTIKSLTYNTFQSSSYHSTNKLHFPCRVEETYEEQEAQKQKIKQNEIELCQSNTILYKIINGKKLTDDEQKILKKLMDNHLEHRLNDMRAEKKELCGKIRNLEKEIGITIKRQSELETLVKEKEEYEKKLNKLINSKNDDIMDRNN